MEFILVGTGTGMPEEVARRDTGGIPPAEEEEEEGGSMGTYSPSSASVGGFIGIYPASSYWDVGEL